MCMRMFAPIAALLDRESELRATGSLKRRPMDMVVEALESMGVSASSCDGLPPLRIRGPITGGEYRIDAGGSSQFLTGLLIALPLAQKDSILLVDNPVSLGYLDLTVDTCSSFGVRIDTVFPGREYKIPGGQEYRARDFSPERDWSGAAFFVAAAATAQTVPGSASGIRIHGLDPSSSQPDRAILEAVRRSGALAEWASDGSLLVRRGDAKPFSFDASGCPDLFPPLAALAAYCPGTSILGGTRRLASKESDRASTLIKLLGDFGVKARVEGDRMEIFGTVPPAVPGDLKDVGNTAGEAGKNPKPVRTESAGDHRIAMAAAILALNSYAGAEIHGWGCVSKSWPSFFEDLERIRMPRGS